MAESFVDQRRRELGITSSAPANSEPIKTVLQSKSTQTKQSDFVAQRKMELGIIPDTRSKNQAPTKQDVQKFSQASINPANSPLMQQVNQFNKDNPTKPTWNGVLDNPIGRTAGKALNAVGQGIDKFETVTGIKNVSGAIRGASAPNNYDKNITPEDGTYLGHLKNFGENAAAGVKNLIKSGAQGLVNPDQATQRFDDRVSGILKNSDPVTKFTGKMLASAGTDPLTFVPIPITPIVKGLRGAKMASESGLAGQVLKDAGESSIATKQSPLPDYSNVSLIDSGKSGVPTKSPQVTRLSDLRQEVAATQTVKKKVDAEISKDGQEYEIKSKDGNGHISAGVYGDEAGEYAGQLMIGNAVTKEGARRQGLYTDLMQQLAVQASKDHPNAEYVIGALTSKESIAARQRYPSTTITPHPDDPEFVIARTKISDIINGPIKNESAIPEATQAAESMKQGWFSNLFGNQGIGISAVKDTKRISKDPLTTEGAIVQNSIKNDAQGIKDSIAAKAREVYQNHVDQLSPLKTISNKTYDSAMDSARSNNIANTIVHDKFVTPEGNVVGQGLGEIFKKVARGNDSQFIDYLTLRHSVTRMERGEQVYADSLNMTPAKAQERLSVLEQRYPGFKDIAKEWDGFNNNVLQHYGVNEGLISENAFNALREKNPNYSPMNRQFSRSEKPGRSFIAKTTSSSFSGQKAPIKEVSKLGSARNIVDPRKSTIENVGAWVNASMRNRTMQSMVDAIKVNPESFAGVAEIVQKPKGGADLNKVLIDGGTDDFVETLNQDFSSLFKNSNVDGENVVRAMVKGEPVYIKVHDPEIVKTLIGMGPQASNVLIDAMSAFSNATKRGATGLLSPVFAVKGATMDLVQSAIQAKNPAKQAAYTVYAIFSGIGDKLNIPGLKNMAEEFRRTGGEYSAALKGDRKLNKSVSDLKRNPILSPQGVAKGLGMAIKAPFKALEGIGNIAENAPRIAASKLELNRLGGARTPENVRQAMSAGREATVNFSRKGAKSRDIEAFVPYNNAAIQGTYRVIKGLKDNPVRTAGAIGTLAVLPKLYEYAQFHDDPDYQNLPARERMRFLIVNKNADGSFTKIPMDPAYNSIGEMTIEALRHLKDNDPAAFKGTADALANAWLSPFVTGLAQGITQGTGVMGSMEGAANSTVGAPLIASIANKSFTGAPIESAAVTDRSPQYRYDEKTSGIAKKIGEVTGFSPMKTDYILRAYGGDPARLLLPLTSDVGAGNVRNTLLKNFIVDPALTNTLTNDFYGAKNKLSQAYRDNQEVGVPFPAWYDEGLRREITSTAAGSISKRLSILSGDKKNIVTDKSLNASQKTAKLREVQTEINNIYVDINTRMDKQKVPLN